MRGATPFPVSSEAEGFLEDLVHAHLKTSIFELATVKNCVSGLCTNPLGDTPPSPPHPIPK